MYTRYSVQYSAKNEFYCEIADFQMIFARSASVVAPSDTKFCSINTNRKHRRSQRCALGGRAQNPQGG